ncbi:MAG TPA: pyruvate kinase alpha/beta domain-containing protein, partial [Bacteroidia bacterium]|nr:pyruvate kinase alpha/beta domain-containing protein [Bacteroidia bacterium]
SLLTTLSLVWGVYGFYYDKYESTDVTILDIQNILLQEGHVKKGDFVINIASTPIKERGRANMIKLSVIV